MRDGLKVKYIVRKADSGEVVESCFVLRPEKDLAAVAAIRAYAASTDNAALAADLLRWVGPLSNAPLTLDELRELDGEPVYIVGINGARASGWGLVRCEARACQTFFAWFLFFEWYGKTWTAYRRRPEEGRT